MKLFFSFGLVVLALTMQARVAETGNVRGLGHAAG